ncbi:hypothetical protein HID58_032578 [Brassica napus]|uniref:Uncharacterized protein n=1 Tax=Brassica napus TaxID=3708 RepID=A0ABQ8BWQ5_BRANA|nr:hypothetical protein HID58_032578 [Brassica napus]
MEKNVEDLKILAEQWFYQGVEFAQHIPKNQLYAAVGALLLTTIFLFSPFTTTMADGSAETVVRDDLNFASVVCI